MSNEKSISVVMPALNEAPRLASVLGRLLPVVQRHFDRYEIILVNDGSTDGTGEVAEDLRRAHDHLVVVHHERPHGLGGACRAGFAQAQMEYVTEVHGKGGTPAEALDAIWSQAGQADLIIPYTVNVRERHPVRRVVSNAFRGLLNGLFGLKVRYYMHHVLYRRRDLEQIVIRTNSYAFHAEAIIKLLRRGRTYLEVGVRDRFDEGGLTRSYHPRNLWGVGKFLLRALYDVYVARGGRQGRPGHRRMPPAGGMPSRPLTGQEARQYIQRTLGRDWDDLLRFPTYVDLDTTNQCNARCIMCGVDFRKRPRVRMSDALFDKILAELARHAEHLVRVGLTVNCEPLLDPALEQKIEMLKRAGIRRTYVCTNGSLLFPQRAERLLKAGLDVTYVSIDSLKKEVSEAIRRGLDFDQVYRNTLEFIRLRDELRPASVMRIQMVLQEQNRDELESFVAHWDRLLRPGDQVVVNRAFNWGTAQRLMPKRPLKPLNYVPCVALWSTMEISANGDVGLCCADVEGRVLLGNVDRQTIEEIWHGPKLNAVRQTHLDGRRSCLPLCDRCAQWSDFRQIVRHTVGRDEN